MFRTAARMRPLTATDFLIQIVPNNTAKLMYSNADYDIRHNFLVDLTYIEPYHFQNKLAEFGAGGWTIAGKAYWRSGLPFTVFNNNAANDLYNGTGNGYVLADVLDNRFSHSCNSFQHPCFQGHFFNGSGSDQDPTAQDPYGSAPQTDFGNVPRNAFYGPHYSDVDLSLYKNIFGQRRHSSKLARRPTTSLTTPISPRRQTMRPCRTWVRSPAT